MSKQKSVATFYKEKSIAMTYDEMIKKHGKVLDNITAIYCRLSKEDVKKKDESNSITNQKNLLENHANSLELENLVFFVDDGVSGKFTDIRPEFKIMFELIEQGKINTVMVKDLSRLGRNYQEMGELTEDIFPYYGIRFISIANCIDKKNEHNPNNLNGGLDIGIAIQNLMNEGYLQNISNSRRLGNISKDKQGFSIGKPPYGYKRNKQNEKLWVIDEEACEVVKMIYQLRLDGLSTTGICDRLGTLQVLIPSLYMERKGYSKPSTRPYRGEYFWNTNTVAGILRNQAYIGDVINFKTFTLSYKDKKAKKTPKNKQSLHNGVHEPIIDRTVWQHTQKTFKQNMGTSKIDKNNKVQKHMLAGYLSCSDCGSNLGHKHRKNQPNDDNFACLNYNRSKSLCIASHHIRIDHIVPIIKGELDKIVRFARDFEDEFVKIVIDEQYKTIRLQQGRNKRDLQNLLARQEELNKIVMSLYEDKVKNIIDNDTFIMMSKNYSDEKLEVGTKVKNLNVIVENESSHVLNVDRFLQAVRVYTSINELTPEILRTFIDRVVIHQRIEKKGEQGRQEVEIYYNFIGQVKAPEVEEKQRYRKSFGRSLVTQKENHTAIAV